MKAPASECMYVQRICRQRKFAQDLVVVALVWWWWWWHWCGGGGVGESGGRSDDHTHTQASIRTLLSDSEAVGASYTSSCT